MNFQRAEKIAAAILYEGYILYPYRPSSIKNRQRWNFGTLYPRVYAEAQHPSESFRLVAECIAIADANSTLDVKISFLQLCRRGGNLNEISGSELIDPSLGWEEAVERTHEQCGLRIPDLLAKPMETLLEINEPQVSCDGANSGDMVLKVQLRIRAEQVSVGACRLSINVENVTSLRCAAAARRDQVLRESLVSAHVLLGVNGGDFVSMLDPQESYAKAVAECRNEGVFPALVGTEPDRHMMLCAPIILYDYPQIAPESEGDFFDGTEMDEMLTLRVLTLTDAEKQEMRGGDSRARKILERTESLTPEQMLKTHGVVRELRTIPDDESFGEWNPFEEPRKPPESVTVFGVQMRVGDRVRLWPQNSADIMDIALRGKVAVIEAIEQDLEGRVQFAVVVDDDPGREFGMMRQPGHRFFYSPEEVEPVGAGTFA